MFEVGKNYNVVTLETGHDDDGKSITYESSIVCEVGAVDGTLVKFLGPDYSKPNKPRGETIINTAGLFFVRAEKVHDSEK
ncbi:hypothetical protein ELI03_12720 [Rhizobium leguminosarum]|uniref:Uncharacterized protein n=1 Tax=Rhizobium leguminosarum TaxID=384 RepID=A0A4Q8Y0C0_RHILE|nr:hypothetical protein [Rhizobium leguminosarum]TAX72547.1 hypothetical protein ELI03_12720 [Rhizobium leguminosarum]